MTNLARRELDLCVERRGVVPAFWYQGGARGGGRFFYLGSPYPFEEPRFGQGNARKCKLRGDLYRAHDTNLMATLRRSIAQSEMEIHPGALLTSPRDNLAGLTLYRLLLLR